MNRLIPGTLVGALALGSLGLTEPTAVEEEPRVVVAVIDAPVNAYHDWFHEGGPIYGDEAPSSVTPQLLTELGIDDDHIIRLTRTGDWQADYQADEAQFDAVVDGELYWYEGTNVIAVDFDPDDTIPLLPDDDGEAHGTGTSGAVIQANPEAVVIVVEDFNSAGAEAWAFGEPAVDIVSTSYGFVGGVPIPLHVESSYDGVVNGGKLHFGSAGNQPTTTQTHTAGGPWWSLGVSGFHEGSSEGREVLSGTTPDFVGDFTQDLPRCGQCQVETGDYSGTSFSAPRAAGTASKVLLEARRAAGHVGGITDVDGTKAMVVGDREAPLTNWELRFALEQAAAVTPTMAYDATALDTAVPVLDAFPWVQNGWGLLSPDPDLGVVSGALAHLGVGGGTAVSKPVEACRFMDANYESKRAYWNSSVFSDSFQTTTDPRRDC